MKVTCTAEDDADIAYVPTQTDVRATELSCWPGFTVALEDIVAVGGAWQTPVPSALAATVRAGLESKWQNRATITASDGLMRNIVLTFDPATAVE